MTRYSIDRVLQLRRAGARLLDRAAWSGVVNDAICKVEEESSMFAMCPKSESSDLCRRPTAINLAHNVVVVPAAVVLGVEMALVEAEETLRDIMASAKEDVDDARRSRLVSKIDAARDAVGKAIRDRGAA